MWDIRAHISHGWHGGELRYAFYVLPFINTQQNQCCHLSICYPSIFTSFSPAYIYCFISNYLGFKALPACSCRAVGVEMDHGSDNIKIRHQASSNPSLTWGFLSKLSLAFKGFLPKANKGIRTLSLSAKLVKGVPCNLDCCHLNIYNSCLQLFAYFQHESW